MCVCFYQVNKDNVVEPLAEKKFKVGTEAEQTEVSFINGWNEKLNDTL